MGHRQKEHAMDTPEILLSIAHAKSYDIKVWQRGQQFRMEKIWTSPKYAHLDPISYNGLTAEKVIISLAGMVTDHQ
jgi:hypothetical protein